MKRIATAFATLMVSLVIAVPASAHSLLQRSVPADDSIVMAPETLSLHFNEPVRLLRVTLSGAGQNDIPFGFQPNREPSPTLEFSLPELDSGAYRVEWTLIGQDGHTVSEQFGFSVESGSD